MSKFDTKVKEILTEAKAKSTAKPKYTYHATVLWPKKEFFGNSSNETMEQVEKYCIDSHKRIADITLYQHCEADGTDTVMGTYQYVTDSPSFPGVIKACPKSYVNF